MHRKTLIIVFRRHSQNVIIRATFCNDNKFFHNMKERVFSADFSRQFFRHGL